MPAVALEFQLCYLLGFAPWDQREIPGALQDLVAQSPTGRALDLGCGRGNHAIHLARHGWQVTGIDRVARALRTARRRAAEARVAIDFVEGDATRLETTPARGPFELLLDCGCFHYLSDPDRARYAGGLARVAAPEATLLLFAFAPGLFWAHGGPRGATADDVAASFAPDWTVRETRRDDAIGARSGRVLQGCWYRLSRAVKGALAGLVMAGAALLPGAAAADQPLDLPRLMAGLAAHKTSTAYFVERRFLAMLKEPLRSTGRLSYVAPDRLEKLTLTPRPQRLAVEGDRVVIDPGPDGGPRTLSLSQQPEIGAFIEAIRGTLAGDLPALERFYTVSFDGGEAGWALRLEPKGANVRKLLASIQVSGKGVEIQTLEFRQADGDRTEMMVFEEPP